MVTGKTRKIGNGWLVVVVSGQMILDFWAMGRLGLAAFTSLKF